MTEIGWILLGGSVTFVVGFAILMFGYFLGGSFEQKFWIKQINNIQLQIDETIKEKNFWVLEAQWWSQQHSELKQSKEDQKIVEEKNISKSTTRSRSGKLTADRDSRPSKSKASSRKRRS